MATTLAQRTSSRLARLRPRHLLPLGPAFVAAIAYVDPGNVAANLTAGARYGYLLVWVLVAANAIAVLVQYLSAKVGLVTGRTLPELVAERLEPLGRRGTMARRAYWLQAELVAAATDIAEVVGGAIALWLLFGLPLVVGGVIVGAVSMLLLAVQSRRGQRTFEGVVLGLLAIIVVGFVAGLVVSPVDWGAAAGGLVPRLRGTDTVLLAASMLGATVMPHAIYLHSALVRDRHGRTLTERAKARLVRATRWDVGLALAIAGGVNIAMLLLAAAGLRAVGGTDTIAGAYTAIHASMGSIVALLFAVGLLASGLASTSVGCYAGAVVMSGLLHVHVPLLARRAVTTLPALVILGVGLDPTYALVLSQVVLSFGIPFALVPLVRAAGSRRLLGRYANAAVTRVVAWLATVVVVVLNLALIVLLITGRS